jgi:hypothetical protein
MKSLAISEDSEYEPLRQPPESFDEEEEKRNFTSRKSSARYLDESLTSRNYRLLFLISIISTLLLSVLSITLLFRLLYLERSLRGLKGFPTDVEDARRFITYEERVFTGALRHNESSRDFYHDVPPTEKRWFGDPVLYPDIDKLWEDLFSGVS